MAAYSETGHAKNVKNGFAYVQVIKNFGADYAPGNASISAKALTDKQAKCQLALDEWGKAEGIYNPFEINRNNIYSKLDPVVRSAINEYKSNSPLPDALKKAKSQADKITGANIAKHTRDIRKKAKEEGKPEPTRKDYHSVSQMSFDNRTTNFKLLIEILRNDPKYVPTIAANKIPALEALALQLSNANDEAKKAWPIYENNRDNFDKELYDEETGFIKLISLSKSYVKALFVGNKEKISKATSIPFRNLKDK